MWLWLSIVLYLVPIQSYSLDTSRGPTSPAEAEILWKSGQKAVLEENYKEASIALQRYIHRYPGQPHYLKAHLLLGEALLETGDAKSAVPLLQDFIEASPPSADAILARIFLGQSYLVLKRWSEAFLSVKSSIDTSQNIPPNLILRSSLVKAQALLGMKKPSEAIKVVDTVDEQLTRNPDEQIQAASSFTRMTIKLADCESLPTRGPLTEGQVLDQMSRRGKCVLEALLIHRRILNSKKIKVATQSAHAIEQAFSNYQQACRKPFKKTKIRDLSKKSHSEQVNFERELVDLLLKDFETHRGSAIAMLKGWKAEADPTSSQLDLQTTKYLENLSTSMRKQK